MCPCEVLTKSAGQERCLAVCALRRDRVCRSKIELEIPVLDELDDDHRDAKAERPDISYPVRTDRGCGSEMDLLQTATKGRNLDLPIWTSAIRVIDKRLDEQ